MNRGDRTHAPHHGGRRIFGGRVSGSGSSTDDTEPHRRREEHTDIRTPHEQTIPATARLGAHPGNGNYPPDNSADSATSTYRTSAYRTPPTHNPHLPPLNDNRTYPGDTPGQRSTVGPRKLTVTRVAAHRMRDITRRVVGLVQDAANADGADQSGLTALLRPVVLNYAVDAAMAVALANTLFFAAASGESKGKVGLYLLLTIAPFALIAPVIGPLLDRIQHGRRIAMATTFGLRTALAILIVSNCGWDTTIHQLTYDPWVLYPCALGLLVLSKSFGVLKSAVTPRVLPQSIDLVRVNSRLTTFGLVGGTIIGGAIAAACEFLLGKALPWHYPGGMLWLGVVGIVGAVMCMRIPSWVEVTEGEVPTTLTYHGEPAIHRNFAANADDTPSSTTRQSATRRGRRLHRPAISQHLRQPLGRNVVTGLWGNGTIRILTGFLTIYMAFYAKSDHTASGWMQLAMLGAVGAAAGVGNFIGNATGTRLKLANPPRVVLLSASATLAATILTAIFGTLLVAAIATLIASGTSAIAKVCLDSSIQDDLPDESRASAFGRSETVLQLAWVVGAGLGVVLPTQLWIGFTAVGALMAVGLAQTVFSYRGTTIIPGLGGRRPQQSAPSGAIPVPPDSRQQA